MHGSHHEQQIICVAMHLRVATLDITLTYLNALNILNYLETRIQNVPLNITTEISLVDGVLPKLTWKEKKSALITYSS